MIKQW